MGLSLRDISVEILAPEHETAYEELVRNAEGSGVSHSLVWRDFLSDLGMGEAVYWLAHGPKGVLVGALPAFIKRSELGAVLNSLPFVQSTGGVITCPELTDREYKEVVSLLIRGMLDWCRKNEVNIACIIGSAFAGRNCEESFPVSPDYTVKRKVNAIDLARPLVFRTSVLHSIRKAQQYSPTLREATDIDEARLVYNIYANNMQRIGVEPRDWLVYKSMFTRVTSAGKARFVWAEVEGEPVASLVLLWGERIVDYFSVGTTDLGRRIQANSWLCNEQILAARAAGLKWWNWMASPNQQVYDFKKRWGGIDLEYKIWIWCLDDPYAWLQMSPKQLSSLFPGFFVLPYDKLSQRSAIP